MTVTPNLKLPLVSADGFLEGDVANLINAAMLIDQILSATQTKATECGLLSVRHATSLIKTQTVVVKHHAFS